MKPQSKYIYNNHTSQEFNQRIQNLQQHIAELEQEINEIKREFYDHNLYSSKQNLEKSYNSNHSQGTVVEAKVSRDWGDYILLFIIFLALTGLILI